MIIWVDTETTGLDERYGHLLEVAVVVTDDDLKESARMSTLTLPVGVSVDDLKMDEVVRAMHTRSGLLDALRESTVRRYEAQANLHAFFQQAATLEELKKTPLAGSTIGFDRSWLHEHMPTIEGLFSYRSIDVSSINELASRWRPSIFEGRPGERDAQGKTISAHRAMPDILASIETLRYYRSVGFVGGAS